MPLKPFNTDSTTGAAHVSYTCCCVLVSPKTASKLKILDSLPVLSDKSAAGFWTSISPLLSLACVTLCVWGVLEGMMG